MTTATHTRTRLIASLVAAIGAAAAIATAPTAGATSNPSTCRESGAAKVCQKQGHSSLHAKPVPRGTSGQLFSSAWLPGYGRGHLPPLIALD